MPFHKDAGDGQIHRIYDQSYADDTARDADTDWNGDSTNIGKCVLVTGDNTVFMLLTTTPSWFEFGGTVASVDTLYSADGTLAENRNVEVPSDLSLKFESFNLTSTTFTEAAALEIDGGSVYMESATGDGFGGTSAISRIYIDETVMQVLDQINSTGMVYAADYSAVGELNDRWIPDKAWVEGHTGGGSIYSTDGTVSAARKVAAEGSDRITLESFNLLSSTFTETAFVYVDGGQWAIVREDGDGAGNYGANVKAISATGSSFLVTDSEDHIGLQYATDYSSNFVDRSLVDKAYADTTFGKADQFLDANRTVSGFTGFQLEIVSYNNTDSDFTERGRAVINDASMDWSLSTGDGLGAVTGTSRLYFSGTQMYVEDGINEQGLKYLADYSTNGVATHGDRWIPDKGYNDGAYVPQSNGGTDVYYVSALSDLPDPVSNLISFSNPTVIYVIGDVDLGANALSFTEDFTINGEGDNFSFLRSSHASGTVQMSGLNVARPIIKNVYIENTATDPIAISCTCALAVFDLVEMKFDGAFVTNAHFIILAHLTGALGEVRNNYDSANAAIYFKDSTINPGTGNQGIVWGSGNAGLLSLEGCLLLPQSGQAVLDFVNPEDLSEGIITGCNISLASGQLYQVSPEATTDTVDYTTEITQSRGATVDSDGNLIVSGTAGPTTNDQLVKYTGFSNTGGTSITPTELTNPGAVAWVEGKLLAANFTGTANVYVYDGFSTTLLDTIDLSATVTSIGDICWDGSHMIISDYGNDYIYVFEGLSNTLKSSFASQSVNPCGVAWDGINLIEADASVDTLYVHEGLTATVQYSININDILNLGAGQALTRGIAFDPTDRLLVLNDELADQAYKTTAPVTLDQSTKGMKVHDNSGGIKETRPRGGMRFDNDTGIALTVVLDTWRTIDDTGSTVFWNPYSQLEECYVSDVETGELTIYNAFEESYVLAGQATVTRTAGGQTDIKYQIAVHVNGEEVDDTVTTFVLQENDAFQAITTPPVTRQLSDGDTVDLRIRNITDTTSPTVLHAKVSIS